MNFMFGPGSYSQDISSYMCNSPKLKKKPTPKSKLGTHDKGCSS